MNMIVTSLSENTKEINEFLEKLLDLKFKGFSQQERLNKLRCFFMKKLKKLSSEDIIMQLALIALQLKEEVVLFQLRRDNFDKSLEENRNLEQNPRIKQKNKIRKNFNKSIQSRSQYAVMPEDFPTILKIAEKQKNEFIAAKYILAIVILKITGIRVGNLIGVNLNQLDNLYNKKTLYVRRMNTEDPTPLSFPYTKAIDIYLDPTRKYYEYMKKCQENNDPRLYIHKVCEKSTDETFNLKSEIWGFMSRTSFSRYLGKILKEAGVILKKNLSSNSFRRGIGILGVRLLGVNATKQILGHAHLSSTEAYVKPPISSAKCTGKYLEIIHNVRSSKSLD